MAGVSSGSGSQAASGSATATSAAGCSVSGASSRRLNHVRLGDIDGFLDRNGRLGQGHGPLLGGRRGGAEGGEGGIAVCDGLRVARKRPGGAVETNLAFLELGSASRAAITSGMKPSGAPEAISVVSAATASARAAAKA